MDTIKYYLVTINHNPLSKPEHHVLTALNIGSAFDKAKRLYPVDDHKSFRLQEINYYTYLYYRQMQDQNIR